MSLKYLQPTIDLIVNTPSLGISHQPNPSQKNIALLREKEKKYNIHIPASIAEWFSLDLSWDLGEVLQIQEIQPLSENDLYNHPQTNLNLWPVMWAEYLGQGFDLLCFQMTGEDDPPIYAEGQDKFVKLAEKFSEFIYTHIWDHHRYTLHKHLIKIHHLPEIGWQVPSKYFIPIDKLAFRYNELSNKTRLHFYDTHTSLWSHKRLNENGEFEENGEFIKQIHIATETIDAMDKTINYLWNGNPPAFLLKNYSFSGTKKLLHDIQKEHTKKIFHSFPTRGWQIETNLALDLGARFPVLSTPMVEVLTYLVNEGFLEMKLENDIRYYRRKGKNSSDNK